MRGVNTRILLAGAVVATLAWIARPSAADLADVHLKSGLTLRGDVSLTENEVILRNAAGELRWPRADVERIAPLTATTTQPAPATAPAPESAPAARPESEGSPPLSADGEEPAVRGPVPEPVELSPAPPLTEADIQRLRLSELRLDGPADIVRVRFLRKGRQRDLPLEVLETLRRRADFRPAWEEVLTRGLPHEKLQLILRLTGTEHAERIAIDSDPAVFDTFRRRVLPLVNRGCARLGCHAGKGARVFRFPLGSTGSDTYAYAAFVLLDQLQTPHGPLLSRANPEESTLLTYMLPPAVTERGHPSVGRGPAFKAVIRHREDRLYATVLDWIDALAVPRPDYKLEYENPYAGRLTLGAAPQATTQPAPSEEPAPETSP